MALPTQMIGGLVSGLDTANIIEQLMMLERRPVQMMETRILEHQTMLEAYRGVNNLLLDFHSKVGNLADSDLWNATTTTSSNEGALTAQTDRYAQPGTYSFRVGQLAQTAQFTSGGFSDRDTSPVSPGSTGEIRIDSSRSLLTNPTSVRLLNGAQGIYHGEIKITDKSGATAVVDLSTAQTMEEVINAINNADGISVTASVNVDATAPTENVIGDALVITDTSGGAGTLRVDNFGGSTTATDLGIEGNGGAGVTITGSRILSLGNTTPLSSLRDGLGINNGTLGSINILDDVAGSWTIDLSSATTIGGIIAEINDQTAGVVTAAVSASGRGLEITLNNTNNILSVTSVGAGNTTAEDLGIAFAGVPAPSITGYDLLADLNSVQVASISGTSGTGINGARGDYTQNLGQIEVVVNAVNQTVDLTDLDGSDSLDDVVFRLNQRVAALFPGQPLTFQINATGNGIEVVNNTGFDVSFNDIGGNTTATDLGLTGFVLVDGETQNAGDLDRNYISRATRLEDLNNGNGVYKGSILITDPDGASTELSLASAETVGEVLDLINGTSLNVIARINATGDGIEIVEDVDNASVAEITVEEVAGGSTAKDLRLLGSGSGGAAGLSSIDGSFERVVSVDTDDTLMDVMNRIADLDARLQVSIINDGSEFAPYRLVVTSEDSGAAGGFILDSDISAFNFQETAKGEDSVLLYGSGSGTSSPIMLTSSTNTNNSAVLGVSLQMHAVTANAVTVTVDEDMEGVFNAFEEMVNSYNTMQDLIKELDGFDEETMTPGILLGDVAVSNVLSTLSDLFYTTVESNDGGLTGFYDIGIKFFLDSDHRAKLEMNSSELGSKLREDFDAVRDLMMLMQDVARRDMNAFATSDDTAGGGTDLQNLINGNTSSSDFGASNGYESTSAIPAGGTAVTVQFNSPRELSRVIINHIDSTAMPAEDYALKDFIVEYQNANTGRWETLRTVSGNVAAETFIGFRTPTLVNALRVNGTATNAADGKFRLLEIEAFESQGIAGKMSQQTTELVDGTSGFFALQEDMLSSRIDDLEADIESKQARLESVELNYLRQFSAMEAALAQLQAQNDFFLQQMNAWTTGQKK